MHRRLQAKRAASRELLGGDRVETHRQQRRAPATVASAGAEADHLGLEDRDAQRRVALQQVVGGPQPGVAGADDGDVDLLVAAQRRAARAPLVGGHRGVPEREVGQLVHRQLRKAVRWRAVGCRSGEPRRTTRR